MNYYSPIEPNPKKPDDLPVGRIIAIVVLFSIGLWPVAVYLIWKTYSESKRPQKRIPPGHTKRGENGKIYGEYRPYQPGTPPAGAPQPPRPNVAPPFAGQPAPRYAAADKPAAQQPANARAKPWWHTALGALGIALIATGSLFSFLGLGGILGGGKISDAVTMFALSAMTVVSGGCFLMVPRTLALQEAKKSASVTLSARASS